MKKYPLRCSVRLQPTRTGEKWSVEELATYLKGRGLKMNLVYAEFQAYFTFDPTIDKSSLVKWETFELTNAVHVAGGGVLFKPVDIKDLAAKLNSDHPGANLAWGRFCFSGDPLCISKISALLK